MRDTASRITKNSSYIFISKIFDFIAGIALVSLAARYLGITDFGKYALIRAVSFMLSPLIAFGSLRILIREISVEKEKAAAFVTSGLVLNCLMTIAAVIIVLVVALVFPMTLQVTVVALCLAVLSQALMIMSKTVGAVFIAYEKMAYQAGINIFNRLLIIIFFLIAIYYNLGITGLLIALVSANAVSLCLAFAILICRFVRPKCAINMQHQIYLFKESFHIAVSTFLSQGYTHLNVFLLKIFRDFIQVSLFQAPQRIIVPLLMLPNSVLFAFAPTISRMANNHNFHSDLRYAYSKILKYILILTLPVCLLVTVCASTIVSFLFKEDFLRAAGSFRILIWVIVPLFANALVSLVITSMKKQKVLMVSSGCCFISNLVLGLVLVQKYGYLGASWASLLSYVVLFAVNFCFLSKYLKFIPIHHIALRPFFACGVMYLFLFTLQDKLNIVLLTTVAFLIYFGVLFLSKTFTPDEIEIFRSAVSVSLKTKKQ